MAVRFGDAVQLEQVGLDLADRAVGDIVPIELVWRTKQKLDSRYKVFVHIGPPDAPPVAQNDSEPAAGFRPTDAWNPGEAVVDRRAVWLKPGTPPGHYGVYAGLYDTATGQRLMAHAADGSALGDRVWLGDIQVNPS